MIATAAIPTPAYRQGAITIWSDKDVATTPSPASLDDYFASTSLNSLKKNPELAFGNFCSDAF